MDRDQRPRHLTLLPPPPTYVPTVEERHVLVMDGVEFDTLLAALNLWASVPYEIKEESIIATRGHEHAPLNAEEVLEFSGRLNSKEHR